MRIRVPRKDSAAADSTTKKLGSSGKHILLSKIKDISQIPHLSEEEEKEDVLSDDDESLDEKVDKDEEDAVEES
ncbi:hypothetical protein Bca4012_053485 [Brassica carinata]|uniref:Uncharacterized protein n=1 Tax=Brassica carinata TaxID=52824 RepID=A0A8X7VYK5_BRACI|nr:hypothetical protein Bca52824_013424 [Brassica carinata]